MTRVNLPNRRPNETIRLSHRDIPFFVTIGYDPETGRPMEVFGSTSRAGSDFAALLSDACVLVSIGLQNGILPSDMGKSMAWSPVVGSAEKTKEPSSPVGAIVALLVSMERA